MTIDTDRRDSFVITRPKADPHNLWARVNLRSGTSDGERDVVVDVLRAPLIEIRNAINTVLNDMSDIDGAMGPEHTPLDGTVPDLSGLDSSAFVQTDGGQNVSIHGMNFQEARELYRLIGDQVLGDSIQPDLLCALYCQLAMLFGGEVMKSGRGR